MFNVLKKNKNLTLNGNVLVDLEKSKKLNHFQPPSHPCQRNSYFYLAQGD